MKKAHQSKDTKHTAKSRLEESDEIKKKKACQSKDTKHTAKSRLKESDEIKKRHVNLRIPNIQPNHVSKNLMR